MSSRILRGPEATSADPLVLRPADGGATWAMEAAGAQRTGFPGDAAQQAQVRAALERGRDEGRAVAAQQAAEQAQQKLQPVLTGLKELIEALASQRQQLRAQCEEDMVRLSIAIAQRVLHREMTVDPEAVLGVVKAAFARLNAREIHRLRVSPDDAQIIQQHRDALRFPPGLEVAADGSLTAGSVVFETTRGEMDASIDSQLAEIGRGLTDVLRRRRP